MLRRDKKLTFLHRFTEGNYAAILLDEFHAIIISHDGYFAK